MTELQELRYQMQLQSASVTENYRMRLSLQGDRHVRGGSPGRTPVTLLQAAKALAKSGSLTSADLAWKIGKTHEQARALLDRVERTGLATSEYHYEGRARIFHFNKSRFENV